jgi:hypothetical protein
LGRPFGRSSVFTPKLKQQTKQSKGVQNSPEH